MDLMFSSRLALAKVIADQAGLRLVEEDANQPRTANGTIYVPKYNSGWTWGSKSANYWWYAFLHEIFHNRHLDDFEVIKKYKVNMRSEFGFLHNLNLDHNIEQLNHNMYPGVAKIMLTGRSEFTEAQFDKRALFAESNPKLDAVWAFDAMVRQSWNSTMLIADKLLAELSDEATSFLEKLMPFEEEWYNVKSAEENYDLSRRIADVLGLSDKAQKQDDESCKGGEDADGEEQDSDSDKTEGKGGIVDYMDMLAHSHDDRGSDSTSGGNVKIDYSNWTGPQGWTPGPFEWRYSKDLLEYDVYYDDIMRINAGEMLATQIRKWLQVNVKARTETGHKRGKINTGRLWRVGAYGAKTEAGRRIHNVKVERHKMEAAVLILMDQSGSMAGYKYPHAAKAVSMLHNVLSELRVPVEIQAFSDYSVCVNYIHKEWSERISEDTLVKRMCSSTVRMGSNADGDSIHHACSRLLARKEQRKIMIVLSDGEPAATSGEGDIYGWTKQVIKEIEEKSPIDLYGIGIMDNGVENLYTNHVVLKDASQLEECLLTLLKNHILV